MEYNTKRQALKIPEYGRHVQKMISHALTLNNKNEQQKCVEPFIGDSYYNLNFIFDANIRKTDTLWDYVTDKEYEEVLNVLKDQDLKNIFQKNNLLDHFGQSSFFVWQLA